MKGSILGNIFIAYYGVMSFGTEYNFLIQALIGLCAIAAVRFLDEISYNFLEGK